MSNSVEKIQLLPCPFCGRTPDIVVLTSPAPGCEDYSEFQINCDCKDSPFLAEEREDLILRWNTRSPGQPISESDNLDKSHKTGNGGHKATATCGTTAKVPAGESPALSTPADERGEGQLAYEAWRKPDDATWPDVHYNDRLRWRKVENSILARARQNDPRVKVLEDALSMANQTLLGLIEKSGHQPEDFPVTLRTIRKALASLNPQSGEGA